jgi:hypothetical protein
VVSTPKREFPHPLDALVPQFIEPLPRDLINGQPLIYHATDDGRFLLYADKSGYC